MDAKLLNIKSRRCAELTALIDRFYRDRHAAVLEKSKKDNEITNLKSEIIRLENEVARLENLNIAPGTGMLLTGPGRIAAGVAGGVNRARVIEAKIRLSRLKEDELPRREHELRDIVQRIATIDESLAGAKTEHRRLGCA